MIDITDDQARILILNGRITELEQERDAWKKKAEDYIAINTGVQELTDESRFRYEYRIRPKGNLNEKVWCYECVRIDHRIALAVYYNPVVHFLSPPILHRQVKREDADCDDPCEVLGFYILARPEDTDAAHTLSIHGMYCRCEPWSTGLDFSSQLLATLIRGSIEPPPAFWELMIRGIELKRMPWTR